MACRTKNSAFENALGNLTALKQLKLNSRQKPIAHMKLNITLLTLLLISVHVSSEAQVRYRVAAGLSTDWITSSNPAVERLASSNENVSAGAGFDGAQMGWGVKVFADLDKQKKFRIPIGFDYFLYGGTQAINGTNYSVRVRHENQLMALSTGLEWSFVEFPWAFARAYLAGEARFVHVSTSQIRTDSKVLVRDSIVANVVEIDGKPAAWRIGAMARIGIEGEIYYPVFLNTSVGWGAMNLIGRDTRPTAQDGRGELLTPTSLNEAGEGILFNLNFTFMIQVRL